MTVTDFVRSKGVSTRKPLSPKRSVSTVLVMSFAAALCATMALPAYAFTSPEQVSSGQSAFSSEQQTVQLVDAFAALSATRDSYQAPTPEELQASLAQEASVAAGLRASLAAAAQSSTQAAPVKLTVNPPASSFSGAAVVDFARQFVGVVPYGSGEDPTNGQGVDCSGFVKYVFAQFGVALPHSVAGVVSSGLPISAEDAQPGDIIVFPGHIGIFAGRDDNGNVWMVDSGNWGQMLHYRQPWTSGYSFVRVGV